MNHMEVIGLMLSIATWSTIILLGLDGIKNELKKINARHEEDKIRVVDALRESKQPANKPIWATGRTFDQDIGLYKDSRIVGTFTTEEIAREVVDTLNHAPTVVEDSGAVYKRVCPSS